MGKKYLYLNFHDIALSFSYSKYTLRIFNVKLSTRTKKLMPVHFRVLLIKLEISAIYCFTYKQDTTEL